MLVASAALAAYAVFLGVPRPEVKDLLAVALAGLCAFALYNVALNYGQLTASAGTASLIVATIPIFTAVLVFAF